MQKMTEIIFLYISQKNQYIKIYIFRSKQHLAEVFTKGAYFLLVTIIFAFCKSMLWTWMRGSIGLTSRDEGSTAIKYGES